MKKIIGKLICFLFKIIPINKNYIFFESFAGRGYLGNSRYIYEELLKQNTKKYKYIWSLKNLDIEIPGNPIKVKRPSLKYFYYAMKSKYWVNNARMPKALIKRKGNVYIQTWHGTPLKKLGFDIKKIKMPGVDTYSYRKELEKEVKNWDYLISPNKFSTKVFKTAFQFKGENLEIGYPRNDLFYQEKLLEKRLKLLKKFKIEKNKKVILYAPTWRDNKNEGVGKYKFTIPFNLQKMKEKLEKNYIILLRTHYLIKDKSNLNEIENFTIDVSDHPEISELYLLADILITDYSSVMFDYANLNKPILFYTYDLKEYRDNLRGFYFDFEKEAPGPLIKTEEELYLAIDKIKEIEEEYKVKYKKFKKNFCYLEDGKSSKRLVEKIWKD